MCEHALRKATLLTLTSGFLLTLLGSPGDRVNVDRLVVPFANVVANRGDPGDGNAAAQVHLVVGVFKSVDNAVAVSNQGLNDGVLPCGAVGAVVAGLSEHVLGFQTCAGDELVQFLHVGAVSAGNYYDLCAGVCRDFANTVGNFNIDRGVADGLEESAVTCEETGQVLVHLISVAGKGTVNVDCNQIHIGLTFDPYGKNAPGEGAAEEFPCGVAGNRCVKDAPVKGRSFSRIPYFRKVMPYRMSLLQLPR